MQKIMVIPIYGNKHINAKDNKMDKYISAASLLISFLLITNYLCGGGVISLFTNIEMTIPNKVSIILFVA